MNTVKEMYIQISIKIRGGEVQFHLGYVQANLSDADNSRKTVSQLILLQQ